MGIREAASDNNSIAVITTDLYKISILHIHTYIQKKDKLQIRQMYDECRYNLCHAWQTPKSTTLLELRFKNRRVLDPPLPSTWRYFIPHIHQLHEYTPTICKSEAINQYYYCILSPKLWNNIPKSST